MKKSVFYGKGSRLGFYRSFLVVVMVLRMMDILNAQPFYVDPVIGQDTYNGSFAAPFKSLTKVQSAVRSYLSSLSSGLNADLYIYLKGGNYPLNATLNFNAPDGGNNGFNVVYKAYNNERPIVSGGKQVTGWTKVAGQEYFVANVPTTGTITYPDYFRQIWVNGRRCKQAKSDFINVYPKPFDNVGSTQVADGYIVKKAAIKPYANLSDIRIFQTGKFKHVEQILSSIADISDSEQVLMMRNPAYDNWTKTYVYNNLNQLQVVNAFEELDEPGEFYLNRTTRKLYYYPQPGENMSTAEVIVPATEYLVKLTGTSTSRVQNLQFEGIDFKYGNWTGSNLTTKEIGRSQADLYSDYTSIEGQISMVYAQNIALKNCRFEQFASSGIYLKSNNNNITIEGNIFNDLTAAAVIIGEGNNGTILLDTSVNQDILIKNNVIRNIGADFYQASGIYANASKNLSIIHNDVADVAYFGINQRYGNSIAEITGALAAANTGNTLIQYNKVTNYGTAAKLGFGIGDEVAGIYFFGVRTSKVQFNYVQYGGKDERLEGAYRQDQYGCGNYWENNVADCKPAARSFSWYDAYNTQSDTLLFANCYANVLGQFKKTAHGDTVGFSYEPNAPAWSTGAQTIINNAGLEPAYQYLLNEFGDGTNIAKKATVTSSSNFSTTNKATNITDQKVATFWKPAAGNETNGSWIQLTFPKPIAINKLQLVPEYNNANPANRQLFEVRVSNDPNFNSYNILGGQSAKPFPYLITYLGTSVLIAYNTFEIVGIDSFGYKYIRIFGRSMSWAECRVYGRDQTILPTNYSSNSSLTFLPYTPLATPVEKENWGLKVEDTTDFSRVYFGSNIKFWNQTGGTKLGTVTVSGGIANLKGGTFTFKGGIYRNERTGFQLKITENTATTTHWIAIRAATVLSGLTNQDDYLIAIKKQTTGLYNTNFQIQRRNRDGTFKTFFGTSGSIGTAILRNTTLYSAFTTVVFETVNRTNGLGIIMKVGSDTVFNFTDIDAKRVTTPGYFVFNPSNTNGAMEITDIPVTGIQLSPTDTSINVNQIIQLNPVVLPESATINKVSYTSSNPAIATVNSLGQVTGLAFGQTIVTVKTKEGGFLASIKVNVQMPLSIEKISLSATYYKQQTILKWRVSSDKEILRFEVEQGNKDDNFIYIGTVQGKNAIQADYSFVHQTVLEQGQQYYYRVKAVFEDGSVGYSNAIVVIVPTNPMKISISPNPITQLLININFDNVPSGAYQIILYGATGKTLLEKSIMHTISNLKYQVEIPSSISNQKWVYLVIQSPKESTPIFAEKLIINPL